VCVCVCVYVCVEVPQAAHAPACPPASFAAQGSHRALPLIATNALPIIEPLAYHTRVTTRCMHHVTLVRTRAHTHLFCVPTQARQRLAHTHTHTHTHTHARTPAAIALKALRVHARAHDGDAAALDGLGAHRTAHAGRRRLDARVARGLAVLDGIPGVESSGHQTTCDRALSSGDSHTPWVSPYLPISPLPQVAHVGWPAIGALEPARDAGSKHSL
jgi:hypothetical protein